MLKFLFITLGLLLNFSTYSDPIKLPKNQEVISTFSGHYDDAQSFHLIITKNEKENHFSVFPYFHKTEGVNSLPAVVFDSKPNMLSYHYNSGVLTLVVSTKGQEDQSTIHTLDIRADTGALTRTSQNYKQDDLKSVIRKRDKSVLLLANTNGVQALSIYDSNNYIASKVVRSPANSYFIDEMIEEGLEVIKTDEYVKHGSINPFKAYLIGDQLTITRDVADGSLQTITFSTTMEQAQSSKVNAYLNNETKDLKKNSSFLSEDQLFQLSVGKKEMMLTVFNVADNSKKSIDLLSTDVLAVASNKEALQKFSRKASKNRNSPTVTINPTKNGNFKARFDYVDNRSYKYQQDWWWLHNMMMQQQQMMMQQQQRQMLNNLPGFGPNPEVYEANIYHLEMKKNNKSSFEIGIGTNGALLDPAELVSFHQQIDKKAILKEVRDDNSLEHLSTSFGKNAFTYIAYHKKSDCFKIICKTF